MTTSQIGILRPWAQGPSETFIDAHVSHLSGRISVHRMSRLGFWPPLKGLDCVLAEYGTTAARAMKICQKKGTPLVVYFHGFDATNLSTLRKYQTKYEKLFQFSSAIVTSSESLKKHLLHLGANAEKILVLPYGVDTDFFTPSDPSRVPPVFTSVGRFVEKKGHELTLFAFCQALRKRSDLKLQFIGTGPTLAKCQRLADQLGVRSHVTFLGASSPEEVRRSLKGSRAFVLHSIKSSTGDEEGTPVAILEAGACALPVISTFHAGIPDVVVPEKTGLLVAEKDIGGMARAILKLADEPELAKELGKKAREQILLRYRLRDSLSKLDDVIEMAERRESTLC